MSFGNEIDYYAGITRNDIELLDEIGRRFRDLSERFEDELHWEKDLSRIDHIAPPHDELKDELYEAIERQLNAPALTPEERDQLLESELPRDVGDRQEVFRPVYEDVGERWTGTLLLYSAVLRNTEL